MVWNNEAVRNEGEKLKGVRESDEKMMVRMWTNCECRWKGQRLGKWGGESEMGQNEGVREVWKNEKMKMRKVGVKNYDCEKEVCEEI